MVAAGPHHIKCEHADAHPHETAARAPGRSSGSMSIPNAREHFVQFKHRASRFLDLDAVLPLGRGENGFAPCRHKVSRSFYCKCESGLWHQEPPVVRNVVSEAASLGRALVFPENRAGRWHVTVPPLGSRCYIDHVESL